MLRRRVQAGRHFALVAVLAAAGCGGSSGPTAADRRAAMDRWAAQADVQCRKANEAIAKRGWPADLVELDRLTVRAVKDVQRASEAIRRQRPPAGGERRIAPFLGSLRELDPLMDRLNSTTEKLAPEQLSDLTPKLQSGLVEVEKAAKELGLRQCAAHDEHLWVPDAIRAPVFAQQLADLTAKMGRRSKAATRPADSRLEASRNLDRLSDVVAEADERLNRLKPPSWATEEAFEHARAVRDLGGALDEAAAELAEPTLTPAELSGVQRKFDRALREETRWARRLAKAVGAVPVLPGGRGGGEEETAPGGEETQPA